MTGDPLDRIATREGQTVEGAWVPTYVTVSIEERDALVEVARAARAFYDDEPVNGVEAVEALRAALARLDKEQP